VIGTKIAPPPALAAILGRRAEKTLVPAELSALADALDAKSRFAA
jgi:hypothetical protein